MVDPTLLFLHLPSTSRSWLRHPVFIGLYLMSMCSIAQPVVPQSPVLKPEMSLRIVGGLASVNQYTRNEEPFWNQELSKLSHGKYSAEIVPFDRAGVPGNDMLRLLRLGVVPFGTTLMSSLLTQYPQYAASDLAGLSPDMVTLKKVSAVFRPYLEHELRTKHNVQMLALYVYPAQVVFCDHAFTQLSDLKGRRVRVSSASQSDFMSALGAIPVNTGFAQIVANMTSDNIDCAVTGTMSGNTLGLHEVASHIHTLPITWGLAIFGANKNAWENLPPDLKALLGRELPKLEAAIWAESERETAEGLACNIGDTSCRTGRKGKMTKVALSAQDAQLSQKIFSETVLPRWISRCGAACLEAWGRTLGPMTGIMPKATP
jgi:TRAP-type C4-dicarboxylate transport system substrate-binding protein